MSIDLGSQFMKIGLVKPGVPMETVLNKESGRKTPTIVALRNGERFFGDVAAQMAIKQPASTFSFFTDLLGKQFENPIVKRYQQTYPHLSLAADELRNTVVFNTDNGTYSVESLLAMVLWNAKEQTEAHAGQPVKDVVITVPTYFNQAERKAVVLAAEIAGLNLLQLLSDGASAGLNYGVFRRKEITEKAQTLLIYDVGASKTTATIVEYRLAKEKNSKEQNPVMSTLGVGFDRTLGGQDLTLRLRDHLVAEFEKAHKTKGKITENPRAMAKMNKEAERVKQVRLARYRRPKSLVFIGPFCVIVDHFAQVESVFEDKDFKSKLSREQLEAMMKDLEPRFVQPIVDALRMAEMSIENVDMVVLFGAGTRIPRIQQLLSEFTKGKELARFLNTDEAAALGAVYQAAHLSKGFKVKKFHVHELQLYPVQVDFTSVTEDNGVKAEKAVSRVIYGYKSIHPAPKKVISFTSHTEDFKFNLNYGPLTHLTEEQLEQFGSLNISEIWVKGVADAIKAELTGKDSEFKGVKAHFKMDNFGVVHVDRAEVVVEKIVEESNSTISKIVNKIGKLFSSSDKDDKEKVTDDEDSSESVGENGEKLEESTKTANETAETGGKNETKPDADATKEEATDNKTDKKPADSEEAAKEGAKKEADDKKEKKEEETTTPPPTPKPKVVKTPLTLKADEAFPELTKEDVKEVVSRLKEYEKREKEKADRDAALNTLESAVYDISAKLEEDSFSRYGTEEELTKIRELNAKIRTWLEDDVTPDTPTSEIKAQKKELDGSIKKLKYRKRQKEERQKALDNLSKALDESQNYMNLLKNVSSLFTESELKTLEKVVTETQEWFDKKTEEQAKLADNVDPVFTTTELKDKTTAVEREVKYLITKMYTAKMKAEQEAKKAEEAAKKANKTKTEKSTADEKTSQSETAAEEPASEGTETSEKPEASTEGASEKGPEEKTPEGTEEPTTEAGEEPKEEKEKVEL
ncbi:hypoxia up-regulated protein 1 precursor [Aphelenchoides avenae]|nr:hypoxia up-regulated protein 1 precursor [Aphelenchus avenae]